MTLSRESRCHQQTLTTPSCSARSSAWPAARTSSSWSWTLHAAAWTKYLRAVRHYWYPCGSATKSVIYFWMYVWKSFANLHNVAGIMSWWCELIKVRCCAFLLRVCKSFNRSCGWEWMLQERVHSRTKPRHRQLPPAWRLPEVLPP